MQGFGKVHGRWFFDAGSPNLWDPGGSLSSRFEFMAPYPPQGLFYKKDVARLQSAKLVGKLEAASCLPGVGQKGKRPLCRTPRHAESSAVCALHGVLARFSGADTKQSPKAFRLSKQALERLGSRATERAAGRRPLPLPPPATLPSRQLRDEGPSSAAENGPRAWPAVRPRRPLGSTYGIGYIPLSRTRSSGVSLVPVQLSLLQGSSHPD